MRSFLCAGCGDRRCRPKVGRTSRLRALHFYAQAAEIMLDVKMDLPFHRLLSPRFFSKGVSGFPWGSLGVLLVSPGSPPGVSRRPSGSSRRRLWAPPGVSRRRRARRRRRLPTFSGVCRRLESRGISGVSRRLRRRLPTSPAFSASPATPDSQSRRRLPTPTPMLTPGHYLLEICY